MNGRRLRVLVVDDSLTVRKRLVEVLEADPEIEVVAEAADGRRGVDLCAKLRPDVVTMDMMMPVMDGPVTIRALQKLNPQVRIIASSGLTDSIATADLDRLGVKTFLIKPYDAKTLLKTVAEALGQNMD